MPITTTPRTKLGPWGVSRFPDGPFTGKSATLVVAGPVTKRDGIFSYATKRDGVFDRLTKRPGVLA